MMVSWFWTFVFVTGPSGPLRAARTSKGSCAQAVAKDLGGAQSSVGGGRGRRGQAGGAEGLVLPEARQRGGRQGRADAASRRGDAAAAVVRVVACRVGRACVVMCLRGMGRPLRASRGGRVVMSAGVKRRGQGNEGRREQDEPAPQARRHVRLPAMPVAGSDRPSSRGNAHYEGKHSAGRGRHFVLGQVRTDFVADGGRTTDGVGGSALGNCGKPGAWAFRRFRFRMRCSKPLSMSRNAAPIHADAALAAARGGTPDG